MKNKVLCVGQDGVTLKDITTNLNRVRRVAFTITDCATTEEVSGVNTVHHRHRVINDDLLAHIHGNGGQAIHVQGVFDELLFDQNIFGHAVHNHRGQTRLGIAKLLTRIKDHIRRNHLSVRHRRHVKDVGGDRLHRTIKGGDEHGLHVAVPVVRNQIRDGTHRVRITEGGGKVVRAPCIATGMKNRRVTVGRDLLHDKRNGIRENLRTALKIIEVRKGDGRSAFLTKDIQFSNRSHNARLKQTASLSRPFNNVGGKVFRYNNVSNFRSRHDWTPGC